ncbi:hypothetical protein [Pseudomonas plecoglossicida]|uniref:hypothetical protein n=1 Tax=Pseudomonas plecoglossicida TaxID=70775 RepID=UPI0015E39831|nr:hypothetical protein [Pseudomonas plecoglossicida]MBA1321204.1 hypothetical protein [Pseudomonas plecoglossicida]
MDRKFKKGDVVKYVKGPAVRKSNMREVVKDGQQMTVGNPGPINIGGYQGVKLPDKFVDKVGCDWAGEDGKARSGSFLESELVLVSVGK